MKKLNRIVVLLILIPIVLIVLVSCKNDNQSIPGTSEESFVIEEYVYNDTDFDDGWDISTATNIISTGDDIEISTRNASYANNIINISKAGTFVLSGEFINVGIIIDINKNEEVKIVLDNACLT
ncbi:MAG: carbohydrate-binding domain-containing protein, partial [Christensenellaceae bacterium]|nr:carbohydrate-binding domain-containing protein [Christensenellaceae bacterium]